MSHRNHPLIAVIGHPNEGKSSVLSTLTEDDSVVVNDYPGETTHCQYFPVEINGEVVLELVDTPGFQNPQRILEWMRATGKTDDALLQAFLQQFSSQPEYHHDCELMQPLAQGAALIFVVDCSRPLLAVDEAEMEILRLINKPRMAVINFKDQDRDYLPQWEQAFRRHFNVIREFNAHQARFPERLALLETLKAIQQSWEPMIDRAITAFEWNWQNRREQVAELIVDYLSWALPLTVEQAVGRDGDKASAEKDAAKQGLEQYQRLISEREIKLFEGIRKLYLHNLFDLRLAQHSVLKEDLFSESTWQVLGLTQTQMVLAAAGMGAGVGVTLEAAFGGLSAGLFATAGAIIGGGSVWFLGDELAKIRIKKLPLGGSKVIVGPSKNPQFPVVLLDRAILYYREIANHAHGNRGGEVQNIKDQSVLRHIESAEQKQFLKLAKTIAENKSDADSARQQLAELLTATLGTIS
ncbi:GTPase/DUF3482 domain-containing protein [Oceanobacter mangrovi]|uniref:GTPase/DUF3482 domain-containing protein n=1 Tax=Oceanobacter mangrovi TaxID=2862510 RepID=UPI001C8DF8E7|nr:GTPase/DUF3482 domain-containing protein [Oceanobacter mangrovi]